MYTVWLEELPKTANWLGTPGGWFRGYKHNWPIYSRTADTSKALQLTKKEATHVIDSARESGYKARAEPPFSITRKY